MDNASKALIMAGAILIAVALVCAIVLLATACSYLFYKKECDKIKSHSFSFMTIEVHRV